MSCCGQKRAEWRTQQTAAPSVFDPVIIRYLEQTPILVQGAVTGRIYSFSGASTIQAVAASDARALEQSGSFQRIR
jgi:hypothetical protein